MAMADALDHVFGYTLTNDVSQRHLQRRPGGRWLKGKSIDSTMPLGPFIVTPDELDRPSPHLECLVNGEIRQDAVSKPLAFGIAELIAEVSLSMAVHPGEL